MSLRLALRARKIALSEKARDLRTPAGRRRAWLHYLFFDHGLLRTIWTNFAEISPGVFRANQPSPRQLLRYRARGINTIVNLRGASDAPHYALARQACTRLGMTLLDVDGLNARSAPQRNDMLALLHRMRDTPKPFVMHCKSGADRTSLAAAIYLLALENASLDTARKQMSARFLHLKWTKTGVLDHILDSFEAAQQVSGVSFEDWLRKDYDAITIQAEFEAKRR